MKRFCIFLLAVSCLACHEDYVPKPKGFLRLEYPEANYSEVHFKALPFTFQGNTIAQDIKVKPLQQVTKSYGVNIEYSTLNGTIFLTYKAVENDKKRLYDFIEDAQKLTLEHTKKADEIPVYPYENNANKVYGLLSEVKGNVASQVQFYVTDSINHFITASLYFNTKPNYDSILPASQYIQKDMKHLMETIKWK
ncbi:gliding motility lipoprotein GldD [Algibacter pacificus]|uniref:gliding motility lipoprotein GldD n=1 Tax=Algibacter pacificus TaxID=2599389 RepID=UPI0011CA4B23|nr:gliding motility lipoprotein GldD [Algibacter pacificus]